MGFTDSERMGLDLAAQRARAYGIDPREYGRLEAKVDGLEAEVAALRGDVRSLLELANKGRGGLWVGMSIAATIGGVITWIAGNVWTGR
jgi:hypothetical protein